MSLVLVPLFCFLIFFSGIDLTLAQTSNWKLDTRVRLGVHAYGPHDLATLSERLIFETAGPIGPDGSLFSYRLGGRGELEAAYTLNRSRYGELANQEGQEVDLRDAYLQYRSGPISFRLGSQSVVWGEAFGSFYADIINPKDLREAGTGDLSEVRRPVEMANLQFIQERWSLQLLYVPFYRSNRLPNIRSDFFPLALAGQFSRTTVDFNQDADAEDKNGDTGARVQFRTGAYDFSVFGFSHIDRMAYFRAQLLSLNALEVRAQSARVMATGTAMTWAGDVMVVRAEFVHYAARTFNVPTTSIFSPVATAKSDQVIGVVGVDWPITRGRFKGWQVGLQYSEDVVLDLDPMARGRRESLAGFQVFRESSDEKKINLVGAFSVRDGSWMLQPSIFVPRDENLEIGVESYLFWGTPESQMGSISRASRVMLTVRGFFRG